jgi:glycerol uptake facilitator-like aquaporin
MSNVNPAPVALPRRLLAEAVGTGLLVTPTSFANPAVTVGRVFTDTFAGITPGSVPLYIGAQIVGAAVGLVLVITLYPDTDRPPVEVVVDAAAGSSGREH